MTSLMAFIITMFVWQITYTNTYKGNFGAYKNLLLEFWILGSSPATLNIIIPIKNAKPVPFRPSARIIIFNMFTSATIESSAP